MGSNSKSHRLSRVVVAPKPLQFNEVRLPPLALALFALEKRSDMDVLNSLETAFAVFVGASCAISVSIDALRRLTQKEADNAAGRKADQLERAYQICMERYEKHKQAVIARVDAVPKIDRAACSDNEITSTEYNVKWAKSYYDQLTNFRRLINGDYYFSFQRVGGATDLDFERILWTLHAIYLADADLELCENGISEDEEGLEWARLREDPGSAASCLRALRRHNRLQPIIRGRRDCLIGRLKYELKYWEYFDQTNDKDLADQKAKAECPLPEWNIDEAPSNSHSDYFYLNIWNGC